MELLNVDNPKTSKGESYGWLTGVLYLAPAEEAAIVVNGVTVSLCQNASEGCKYGCLNRSGHGDFDPNVIEARIRRARELFADRPAFLNRLRKDIEALIRKANREGLKPAVRLNGTSDLYWLVKVLAPEFPTVQFYDYTKLPRPELREMPNYHLTFSLSEINWDDAKHALSQGFNLAVPFDVKRGKPLPETWRGLRIVDGDLNDLRFLDGHQGVVIGLRAKGRRAMKSTCNGFIQLASLATA